MMDELQKQLQDHFLDGIAGVIGRPGASGNGQALTEAPTLNDAMVEFRDILTWKLPERKTHVVWIREGGIIMVFGPRGVGKTMLQLALAAALTTGTDFLRWKVSAPVGVLFVDGEMPLDELRTRLTALSPEPPTAPLFILTSEIVYQKLERDLVLTSLAMQEHVTAILDAHPEIRVVIFDNISTLFSGIDEDRKRDWEPIQSWLIRLRHRGLAVVLVHHAGKMGQQRGTSGREDALDTVIELGRPANYDAREGCHFELKFTKSRSVKGEEVTPLDVRLLESGTGLMWDWKALEKSKEEQVKDLLRDGIESPGELAEALGITRSYAWKLKRRVEKQLKEV